MDNVEAQPVNILLIEDDEGDIRLAKEALKEGKILNRLFIVEDGVEALDFLYRRGKYADPSKSPRPGLILLDLNLPKMNGLDVLRSIKSDPELRRIPVIILTTSKEEEDIIKSYDLDANSYITKPVDHEKFIEAVHSLRHYWLTVVTLPPR